MQTAEAGDVIFFGGRDASALATGLLQKRLDPDAATAVRTFGHVAIVLDGVTAIEAMPSEMIGGEEVAVVKGAWTGIEIETGVRLIPLADLVVPALQSRVDIVVLRKAQSPEPFLDGRGATHPGIAAIIGSGYSIELLREQSKTLFWPKLVEAIGGKVNWRSQASDASTAMGIDEDFRTEVLAAFPGLDLPQAARTYFCSQLVIAVLNLAGVLPDGITTDLTTPTGLRVILADQDWSNVSDVYTCGLDGERFFAMIPNGAAASYVNSLAMAKIAAKQSGVVLEANILEAGLQKMRDRCDEMLRKLKRD